MERKVVNRRSRRTSGEDTGSVAGVDLKKDSSRHLTAEDIFRGGDDPYTPVEVPQLKKGGGPGVVFIKQPSAGAVLDFTSLPHEQRNEALIPMIAECVVTPDGEPMFTENDVERIRDEVSMGAINVMGKAVIEAAGLTVTTEGDGTPKVEPTAESAGNG